MKKYIKTVVITACEGKNGVSNHYPKTLNSLDEATNCINGDGLVDGKVRFTIETNTGDTYEGTAYKDDSYFDLEKHVKNFLRITINSNLPYITTQNKEEAKEWRQILEGN